MGISNGHPCPICGKKTYGTMSFELELFIICSECYLDLEAKDSEELEKYKKIAMK